jgi:glycosyltransferase involved in cell wall biosynthesis
MPDGSAPIPEYVVDPSKDDIVPPKELNAEELEERVVSLLKDEERMKRMGEALYAKTVTKFTQGTYFNDLEGVHKGIFKR